MAARGLDDVRHGKSSQGAGLLESARAKPTPAAAALNPANRVEAARHSTPSTPAGYTLKMIGTNVKQNTALGEQDVHLFREGTHGQLYRKMGCQLGTTSATFRVWAPNARSVDVLGDFNDWRTGAKSPLLN